MCYYYSKLINQFEFEHEYQCDDCDKHFGNGVGYENYIMRKCLSAPLADLEIVIKNFEKKMT